MLHLIMKKTACFFVLLFCVNSFCYSSGRLTEPEFPGGEKAMKKHIEENFRYPQSAIDSGIQGTVFVTFVIDTNGGLRNIKVARGIGGGCDDEAIRLVEKMPNWKPGTRLRWDTNVWEPAVVQFVLPIKFSLNEELKRRGADTLIISGIVTDENGKPLSFMEVVWTADTTPKRTIQLQNVSCCENFRTWIAELDERDQRRTFTDIDGKYTLNVPKNTFLEFDLIGFKSQKIVVKNQQEINVVLKADPKSKADTIAVIKANYLFMWFRYPEDTIANINRLISNINEIVPIDKEKEKNIKQLILSKIEQTEEKLLINNIFCSRVRRRQFNLPNFIPVMGINANDIIKENFSSSDYEKIYNKLVQDRMNAGCAYDYLSRLYYRLYNEGKSPMDRVILFSAINPKSNLDKIFDFFGI